ncbi:MAG: bifunctional aspartate kinase/homoserine dehydrogenase I, partial [Patescibacteria group bacterium]
LLQQLRDNQTRLKEEGIELCIMGLANVDHMLLSKEGIDLERWNDEMSVKGKPLDLSTFIEAMNTDTLFVDCTASQEVADRYPDIARAGAAIVAANKKAQSGSREQYEHLWNVLRETKTLFFYETNVGAALPVIATLKSLVRTGDRVEKIEAILSGTLSYIFNMFSSGDASFSDIVRSAKEKGYTEPDPRDDLSGMDVARKAVILAREMGQKISVEDIERKPILSESCFHAESVDTFFDELKKEDDVWSQRRDACLTTGTVFRYIATVDRHGARIALQEVGTSHPFYSMQGSDNIIAFTTARYCDTPLVIKGPGAGAQVTAAGVFADILKVTDNG